jgi:hypothetical protein
MASAMGFGSMGELCEESDRLLVALQARPTHPETLSTPPAASTSATQPLGPDPRRTYERNH